MDTIFNLCAFSSLILYLISYKFVLSIFISFIEFFFFLNYSRLIEHFMFQIPGITTTNK